MAESRRPFQRILRIHNRLELRKPHVATKSELINLCQISERTLKSDISFMRDVLDAPLIFNRKEKGWHYTEKYDISKHLGFTENQFNRLRLGLEIITQYRKIDLFEDQELDKMHRKLHFTESNPYNKYIYFEEAPYYQGADLIGFFLQAIEEHRCVQFEYESYKEQIPNKRLLQPYVLKERDNRWYLIGKLPQFNGAMATYALDRIKQNKYLKVLDDTFTRDPEFNIDDIFKYTYGMSVLKVPVEEVMLSFSTLQACYFRSKPFYPYELIDQSRGKFVVKMEVIPNWEFIHKIMSFGDGVEVLAPKELRKKVKEEFQRALGKYI